MLKIHTSGPNSRRALCGLVAALALLLSATASAGTILPGLYRLLDHPDGNVNPPPYGLRMDVQGYTFSTELGGANVILNWDGGATATITGTLWNNQLAEIWDVDYTLTGVVAAPANLGFSRRRARAR